MINKELLLYIQAQIAAGMPQEIIKEILMARGGWRAGDIDEAFRSIQNPVAAPAPTPTPTPMVSVAPAPTPVIQSAPQPVVAPAIQTPAQAPTPTPVVTPTPKPQPSTVRMPGTTLISQSPELSAAPTPVAAPTAKVVPPQPVVKPIIEITPAPRPTSQPVVVPKPIPTPASVTPPSMTINDIKPPMQSVYQPTRVEPAPAAAPTPAPMMQAPMMSSMQMQQPIQQEERIIVEQPSGKGKKIALGVLGLLVVLLGAGGAYGYFNYISPSPKVAFQRVVPQITEAKTGHFKVTAVADFDKSMLNLFGSLDKIGADSPEGVQISKDTTAQATLILDGMFDRTDASASKADTTVTFSTTAAPVTLSVQTKFANATFFVKVPDLGLLADLAGGNTGAFLPGDWVSFNKADLDSGAFSLPAVPQNLTSEKQNQITQLFLNGGIIVPTLELSKEVLGGATMHRYQFTVDQKALKQALIQSYTLATGTAPTDIESQSIDTFLAGFSITDGELWVGVWDRKPYKIVFNVKPAGELSGMVKNVKFDISLDSFGLPVSITAPVSAKPFTALFDEAQKKAQDAGVKAGLGSVTPIAEIYYSQKRTYLGLCTSTNGLSQMLDSFSKRPAPNTPYCKDSARFYAVAMPLASESGVSCIDNAGKIVSLAAVPTGTSCK